MVNEGNDTGIDRVTPTGAMRGRSPRMLSGMVWMALGIVAGFMVPFFGVVMTGYGMREMVEASGLSVRIIFALQGFGVVLSLMGRYRLGCFGRTALTVLSIWLETMFFLVSIVGLVDVWANFRKLERSSSRNRAHS